MAMTYDICDLDDIPDQKTRGFSIEHNDEKIDFFIVRKNENVFGYINRCPHTGVNLDWQADQFLEYGGQRIQCSTHGALFRIRDGYCIYGPCAGRYLTPVRLVITNDRIQLIRD